MTLFWLVQLWSHSCGRLVYPSGVPLPLFSTGWADFNSASDTTSGGGEDRLVWTRANVGGMGSAQSTGAESLVLGGLGGGCFPVCKLVGLAPGVAKGRSGKRRMRAIYSRSCVFDWLIKRSADLVEDGSDIDTEYKR